MKNSKKLYAIFVSSTWRKDKPNKILLNLSLLLLNEKRKFILQRKMNYTKKNGCDLHTQKKPHFLQALIMDS